MLKYITIYRMNKPFSAARTDSIPIPSLYNTPSKPNLSAYLCKILVKTSLFSKNGFFPRGKWGILMLEVFEMIYCVEDDSNIRDLMLYALQAAGFEAAGFEESGPFWEALKESLPDLILLDIMLPEEDGLSILKKLRSAQATAEIPVIMATAKGSEYDKVIGLDLGADDYLVKPFGMLEMVARIKAVLRRTSPVTQSAVLTAGPISLDPARHTVLADGSPVLLTLKEFDILRLLLDHPGQVFSRAQLLEKAWGIDYAGETRTVDVHIGTLRTKLGDAGRLITTVRGVGYKLEVPDDK